MNKNHESIDEVEEGVHSYSNEKGWVKPKEKALLDQLEWFKDQKLGIMMHWGPYSQLGVVESWALSDEDAEWSRDEIDWVSDSEVFKQQYVGLNKTFNPVRFEPDKWADVASENGFKYLVFTTKHHDGFAMWDTKTTEYKITGSECPFHTHPKADICKELFDAFRAKGLPISAYFSKADWHVPTYWAKDMQRGTHMWRGPSYNPLENQELWEDFVQFTHEQMNELLTRYGRIEVLWLDAGWVSADNNQDIRLGEVVERARETQPWLLAADRTVGGTYENIITPEQTVPSDVMHVPWEACITMGSAFSFRYEDTYKSGRELVHLLLEVVAKGGNLALNVAPQPDGRLPRGALSSMNELGSWLSTYGEGIYGTRPVAPYFQDGFAFTQKEGVIYAFHLQDEKVPTPEAFILPYFNEVQHVELVYQNLSLSFKQTSEGIHLNLPSDIKELDKSYAYAFKLT